jgi:2-oxoglutarate dehydrogenase E1 component
LSDAGHPGLRPIYAGRDASASPATGLAKRHQEQQEALIAEALRLNRKTNSSKSKG